MAEIGCVSFNAWEMVHGSAVVVIDCDFGKVVGYVLQESVMDVCHVSSVCWTKAQSHSPVLRLQPIQSAGRKALTQSAGSMILTQHQEKDEKNETSQF